MIDPELDADPSEQAAGDLMRALTTTPRTLVDAQPPAELPPAAPEVLAPEPVGPGCRSRARWAGALALVIALAAGGAAVAVHASSRTARVTGTQQSLDLPDVLSARTRVQRTWSLDAAGDRFTSVVTVTSTAPTPQDATWVEVVPESLAATSDDVLSSRAPEVLQHDPVLRWSFPGLAAGASSSVTWSVDVPPGADHAVARLAAWQSDQRVAEAAYRDRLPATGPLRALVVLPSAVHLLLGATAELSASGTSSSGQQVSGVQLSGLRWSTSAPGVVSVDAAGRVGARHVGSAVVTAAAGGRSVRVTVVVTAPATASPHELSPATLEPTTAAPSAPARATPIAARTTPAPRPRPTPRPTPRATPGPRPTPTPTPRTSPTRSPTPTRTPCPETCPTGPED